jgi:molybdopterin-guanine dinucleotide biosynthesis protein A
MRREKAFVHLAGRPLLAHVIGRLAPQTEMVFINANGDQERFASFGLKVFADIRSDIGTPLAGLHACLHVAAAEGFDAVLTTPSDTPFLPSDLVQRLSAAGLPGAIAVSGDQSHGLTGLWSVALRDVLEAAILQDGLRRVQDWALRCAAASVRWSENTHDPFFNVNTPEDLAQAERIAADFAP